MFLSFFAVSTLARLGLTFLRASVHVGAGRLMLLCRLILVDPVNQLLTVRAHKALEVPGFVLTLEVVGMRPRPPVDVHLLVPLDLRHVVYTCHLLVEDALLKTFHVDLGGGFLVLEWRKVNAQLTGKVPELLRDVISVSLSHQQLLVYG